MIRFGLVGAALLVVLVATRAGATPPQTVADDDLLFGANDSHLFLLRRIDDNMGRYQITQTDILLVSRTRATNADDAFWPVSRTIDYGTHFAELGEDSRVQTLPLEGAVNPFDILAAQAAIPMLGVEGQAPDTVSFQTVDGTLTIVGQDRDESHRIGLAEIADRITGNLDRGRDALPAHFIEGADALRDLRIDAASDCEFDRFLSMADLRDDLLATTWLVHVTCENDEMMAPVSTYLVVPRQR
ncbi:MAG: hypothetical protein HC844_21240 [Tabrizicola sp.]|nr:hypothetical protein [Tabrizicola sp.]